MDVNMQFFQIKLNSIPSKLILAEYSFMFNLASSIIDEIFCLQSASLARQYKKPPPPAPANAIPCTYGSISDVNSFTLSGSIKNYLINKNKNI